MNREIKFRAKSTAYPDSGWIYWGVLTNPPTGIIHESLGELTPLLDRENKKIWEGDILEYYIFNTTPVPLRMVSTVIEYQGTYAVLTINGEPYILRDAIRISNTTLKGALVLGNIYENPELITNL